MLLFVMFHKDTNTGVEDQKVGGGAKLLGLEGHGLYTPPLACRHLPVEGQSARIPTCTY